MANDGGKMRRSRAETIDWLDRAAVTGSAACMVHWLALPLLIAAIPALSAVIAVPESVHRWILLLATPLAIVALIGGHGRHATTWPIVVGGAGLAFMAIGAFAVSEEAAETALTVTGSLLVAVAHIGNWRLRRDGLPR